MTKHLIKTSLCLETSGLGFYLIFVDFEHEETRDLNPDDWPNDAYHRIPKVLILFHYIFENIIKY